MAKLHKNVAKAVKIMQAAAKQYGFKVKVTSTVRTKKQQEALYKNPQGYPVATPGRSQHEYGLAVDMLAVPYEGQELLHTWWTSIGGYHDWSDAVHFAALSPAEWAGVLGAVEIPPQQLIGAQGGTPAPFPVIQSTIPIPAAAAAAERAIQAAASVTATGSSLTSLTTGIGTARNSGAAPIPAPVVRQDPEGRSYNTFPVSNAQIEQAVNLAQQYGDRSVARALLANSADLMTEAQQEVLRKVA